MLFALAIALAASVVASHPTHHVHPLTKRKSYPNGIATFNNYAAQGNTNCGPSSGQSGTYGAAASDISPGLSPGTCSGSLLMSQCAGQSVVSNYNAPGCPKSNCGKCYKVTNKGGIEGTIGGVGNSITVQIIDACPSSSAYNFCKTDVPANQRCGDPGTNQLDIDQSAYMALTGQPFGSGPSLNIDIEDANCSGATDAGGSTAPDAPVQSSPSDLAAGLPGVHAAGGDKVAEHRVGAGNFAIQDLGSSSSAAVPSSTSTPPPPPQATATTASSAPATTTSDTSSLKLNGEVANIPGVNAKAPGSGTDDDEECDEL